MTKLQRFAAHGRFPGTYVHPTRGEIAATDGHSFVCLGATSLTEARELLAQCPDPDDAPPVAAAARVWALDEPRASVEVTSATEPDPELWKLATEGLSERELAARERVTSAQARLEEALKQKLGIGSARENLAEAKADAREAARELAKVDAPTGHALRVGDACVDLRLVRRCLAALGATRGTLVAASELGATLLETTQGVALVMPFRQ